MWLFTGSAAMISDPNRPLAACLLNIDRMSASPLQPMNAETNELPSSDLSLVLAYQAGYEQAATELVRRLGAAVARYLYGAGAPQSDIDDLVQEAFFRAFRALASWRGEASFKGWLFRIAGNVHKDMFRRQKGRTMVALEDQELASRSDPAGDMAADETETRLREGIGRLPRLQREVFLMRVQQGLDYDEISRVLSTTTGAARVHYHHAVKRLRELVQ